MPIPSAPFVPDFITVHLGPPDSDAENVTVSFPYYIKNVASSEIYPTWEQSAIYANIYAQISYALNRVYTEFYRVRGYDFDITNSPSYDQSFSENRQFFETVSLVVDDFFNDYLVRNELEPIELMGDIDNVLGLMYSEVGENEDWTVQVSFDLATNETIVKLCNNRESFIYKIICSIESFILELQTASWEDYYSWAQQIAEEKFSLDIEF